MGKIKRLIGNIYTDFTSHWKKPAKGNFVSYKEITAYSIGGMGQQLIMIVLGYMGLGASNTLFAATLRLQPMHLQLLAMVQSVLGMLMTMLRGQLVDNTRSRWGRFRPYMAIMGFPVVILTAVFMFLPFKTMTYNSKLLCAFLFSCAVVWTLPLYTDTYTELRTVISPKSSERGKVISISSIIFSFAPTIYYAFTPALTDLTGGWFTIETYQYVMLPFAIVGVLLGIVAAVGTKERTVVSKAYVPRINMFKGVSEIYRNKYWVLRFVSGQIGFLEGSIGVLMTWIFMYDNQNMALMGVSNTIMGTASGIAMLISPFILNRLGSRNTMLVKEGLNIVFITLMFFSFKNLYILFIFVYFNTLIGALNLVVDPVIHSEVKDYQQYLSGRRMDFTFGTAGIIAVPIGLLTGLIIPFVYESFGLTKNYDILYDPVVRNAIFRMLCILAIVGAALNFLPLSFYDLTRSKHNNVVKVLRVRALFEDYMNKDLNPQNIKTGIEEVREAQELYAAQSIDTAPLKERIKDIKKQTADTKLEKKTKAAALRAVRKELREAKAFNERKNSANILINEMNKYDTEAMQWRIETSLLLTEKGLDGIGEIGSEFQIRAEGLPDDTKERKKFKRKELKRARRIAKMAAKVRNGGGKKFPNGIQEPDPLELATALDMPEETKAEKKARREAIKTAEKHLSVYNNLAAEYIEAEKLLLLSDAYGHYSEIEAMYDKACEEVLEQQRVEALEEAKEIAAKEAELERIRKEKFDKLPPEKQAKVLAKREKKEMKNKAKAAQAEEESTTAEDNDNEKI